MNGGLVNLKILAISSILGLVPLMAWVMYLMNRLTAKVSELEAAWKVRENSVIEEKNRNAAAREEAANARKETK